VLRFQLLGIAEIYVDILHIMILDIIGLQGIYQNRSIKSLEHTRR
jgi:hypothetical protein